MRTASDLHHQDYLSVNVVHCIRRSLCRAIVGCGVVSCESSRTTSTL